MTTTRTTATVLTAVALVLTAAAALAAPAELLAPAAGDLTPTALVSRAPAIDAETVESEPLSFAWPLDPSEPLERPAPHASTSFEYRLTVSVADLAAGVELPTHGAAAVVRLNPVAAATAKGVAAVDPTALVLVDPSGRSHRAGTGMDAVASAADLSAAGSPFAAGTAAFRIRRDLGSGRFRLAAPELASDASFVIHVLDRESELGLSLTAAAPSFLAGSRFRAVASVAAGHHATTVAAIRGTVISPAGAQLPATFTRAADGSFTVDLTLPVEVELVPGLWEVAATLEGEADGLPLRRDVRTAFACAVPTARLAGRAEVTRDAAGSAVVVGLDVEVAAPSRYELRGVLYGTAADGRLRPAAMAHAAAWSGAGLLRLDLSFTAEVMDGAGLDAPYELRDLQLLDQARMGVLQVQERALIIE